VTDWSTGNRKAKKSNSQNKLKPRTAKESFNPKRFPSYFKLESKAKEGKPVTEIPLGGERTIKFSSDVENQYFVRVEEPDELKIALVKYKPVDVSNNGGDLQEFQDTVSQDIEDIFDVIKKSPNEGTIKIILRPSQNVQVGDALQVKTTLTNPGKDFNHTFWVKISYPEMPKTSAQKEAEDERLGLPSYILVYKEDKNPEEEKERITWEKFEKTGQTMSYQTIVHPLVEGDTLESIYINMDSSVLKDYKSRLKAEESFELADKRYITAVYFHTLFLYTTLIRQIGLILPPFPAIIFLEMQV